ncbi:uncharacterized protein LOC117171323 [Belonocnema kinseyi]|uniref:uncharacterized protein LOC117171323 n=1 Tax=Belonocnema kinseyi TaxID=2817044 RepID=UPI00143CE6B8|nr:uncharacterized protein LOC117171323 [Belonocnema kinseyi]
MNFAIFYCLLGFCAFSIVNGLTKDVQIYDLEEEISDDLYKLVTKKQAEFQVALKSANHKTSVAACENTFSTKIADFVVNSVTEYEKCSHCGPDMLKLKPALACTENFFKSSLDKLDSYLNQGKACLGIQGKSKAEPKGKLNGKHEGKPVGEHKKHPEGKQEKKPLK